MESLSKRMSKIAALSKDLSTVFNKHRANVSQLSDANRKVKGLQFLLCLPQKLQVSDLEVFHEFFLNHQMFKLKNDFSFFFFTYLLFFVY